MEASAPTRPCDFDLTEGASRLGECGTGDKDRDTRRKPEDHG